jgi:signal transduction histidine kinase
MDTKMLSEIIRDINSQIELDECLKTSIEKVTEMLGVEIGSLMLLDKQNQELSIKVAKGLTEDIVKNVKTKVGEGVSGWVAKNKQPLLIRDIGQDRRFQKRNGKYYNNSLLSVPLIFRDEVLGVININNKVTKELFEQEDLDALEEISTHISNAIDKALRYGEAKRLSQIKLDFVSIVSHELRSPLTAVKEAMGLLLERIPGEINKNQEKFITIARNNVDRVLNLINELLDISKLEAGRMDMKRNFDDLCNVTRHVYETLKISAGVKNIKLTLEIPDKDVMMWFDSEQITRVLVNLVGNAVKFTQENGMVSIRMEELGRFVTFSIIDNGPGIAEEDLDKVFDKFYSVAKAASSDAEGTGLGLPLAKEIVELHKGRIWVESELGQGSNFSFMLPKDIRTM